MIADVKATLKCPVILYRLDEHFMPIQSDAVARWGRDVDDVCTAVPGCIVYTGVDYEGTPWSYTALYRTQIEYQHKAEWELMRRLNRGIVYADF